MGYLNETIKGISWLAALRGVTRGLSFLRVLVLARLLTPSQFGLFGVASFMLALVEVLTETGINIFLVQKKGSVDSYINSAWIVSILRGFLIFLILITSAPFVASFFNARDALSLLILISIVPLIRGFINPSIVKFQKDLKFGKEFYFRSAVSIFEVIISIFLVYITNSPIGLVVGIILSAIFEVIASFIIAKPRPRIEFKKANFFEVIHTGKWVTLNSIFSYFYQNADDMAIVKILNTSSLGLYQMAYKISMLPITEVADVVARVTFPVYTKISGDRKRLKSAFFKTSLITFLVTSPIIILFIFFPAQLIVLVLGEKWIEASEVLRILAVFGLARAVTSPALILLLSLKKQDIVAKLSIVTFLLMAVTLIPFINAWGIVGAAVSSTVASVLVLPAAYFFAIKNFQYKK